MLGKLIIGRDLALIFLAFALPLAITNPLSAQFNLKNIPPEGLAEEGPLTQKDIDFYISFAQFFAETLEKNAENSDFDLDDLDKEVRAFILAKRYPSARFNYLSQRIMRLYYLIAIRGEEPIEADRPAYLTFTAAEKQLIKDNMNKLEPAINRYLDSF
ncbi:MAG: hypothetical protein LBT38_03340 [Deltaproteobacteria bacterium]|jgi:hypothetical protein|nr:hypothetical protein [Deltaproteobacteria bacterium]